MLDCHWPAGCMHWPLRASAAGSQAGQHIYLREKELGDLAAVIGLSGSSRGVVEIQAQRPSLGFSDILEFSNLRVLTYSSEGMRSPVYSVISLGHGRICLGWGAPLGPGRLHDIAVLVSHRRLSKPGSPISNTPPGADLWTKQDVTLGAPLAYRTWIVWSMPKTCPRK